MRTYRGGATRSTAVAATALLLGAGMLAGTGVAGAQDTGSIGVGAGSSDPPTVGSLRNDMTAPVLEMFSVSTTLTQPPGPRAREDCEAVRKADLDLQGLHWGHSECLRAPDGAWYFTYRQLPAPLDVALAQIRFHS